MRVLIIGAGSLGLSLAARLALSAEEDVTRLDVRILAKTSAQSVEKRVHLNGKIVVLKRAMFEVDEDFTFVDLAFFCVRFSDLDQAIGNSLRYITSKTCAVALSNGLRTASYRESVFHVHINSASVYAGASRSLDGDFSDLHDPMKIVFSRQVYDKDNAIRKLAGMVDPRRVFIEWTSNIEKELLQKTVVSSAINGACILAGSSVGQVQRVEANKIILLKLFREGVAVASAEGLPPGISENNFLRGVELLPTAFVPSLLAGLNAQNRTDDIYQMHGYIIALGKHHCISVPTHRMVLSTLNLEI